MTTMPRELVRHRANSFVPIKYEYENGVVEEYELRKATAEQAARFVDARTDAVKVNSVGNIVGIRGGNLPLLLVGMCVYYPGDTKPVGDKVIKTWDGDFTEQVFNAALDMSQLRTNDQTLVELMREMFNHEESPIKWKDLQEFINSERFEELKYKPVKTVFYDRQEELRKAAENF